MKKYLAEFIGTFAIVFCGTGAIVIDQHTQGMIGHAGIAITFGLIVMVMIYTFGELSGAHFNPAVSIGFTLTGRFAPAELLPYLMSQFAGGLLGSSLLHWLFPNSETLGASLPSGTPGQSFIFEFILTFLLMLVICQVATGSREQGMFAGLAIGATIMLEAMFAGPVCGASMNPARSLSPALLSGHTEHLWIYLTAPVGGASLGVAVWKFLRTNQSPDL